MKLRSSLALCGFALNLLIASPVVGQQPSESGADSRDPRLISELKPLGWDEQEEVRNGRGGTNSISSASVRLPGPRPLATVDEGASQHRTFLRFGLSLSQNYDDNVGYSSVTVSDTFSLISPSVSVERLGRRAYTSLRYQGDGRIYGRHPELNIFGHDLTFLQAFHGARWSGSFSHSFIYTPDRLGLLFALRARAHEVTNLLGPEQSLVIPRADRIFNATTAELQYSKSVRTSFSLSGSYLDARARHGEFVTYSGVELRAAYNYRYTQRSTLSLFPDVRLLRFTGDFRGSKSYAFYLGHSYQAGRRVWVSLHAGPQYTRFEQTATALLPPELASLIGLLEVPPPRHRSRMDWSGAANLVYNRHRSAFGVSYLRGVAGSGGLAGPVRNQTVQAYVSNRLFGRWSSTLSGAYSDNRGLDGLAGSYDAVTAGLRLERPLGESMSFFVGYDFLRQISSISGLSFTRNLFTVGFGWGSPPILVGR